MVVFSQNSWNFSTYHFKIDISGNEDIDDLKKTVKNVIGKDLSHLSPPKLTIWRCKDRKTRFDGRDVNALHRQISKLLSGEEIEVLNADDKLMDLRASVNETLLVEVPSTSLRTSRIFTAFGYVLTHADDSVGDSISSDPKVDRKFESLYLRSHIRGKVTEDDIEFNDIVNADETDVPKSVKEHEEMLHQKRNASNKVSAFLTMCTSYTDD